MTAKRFNLFEDLDILDNNTGRIIPPCLDKGLSELVDLLNQLNEENEQLKQEMGNLGTAHAEKINKIEDEFYAEILKLEKENKQLKHKLDDWHQRTFKAHEYFNILEKIIDEVCDDDISNKIWKEYEKKEKLIE